MKPGRRIWITVLTLGFYSWRRKRRYLKLRHQRRMVSKIPSDEIPQRRVAFNHILAGLAAGAAIGYSSESKAISADSIANVVTNKMQGMLQGLLGPFLEYLAKIISGQNDKAIAAQAKSGDAIRSTMLETHNQDVLRESEPPPDACRSSELGEQGQQASENALIGSAKDDVRQGVYYSSMTASSASRNRKARVGRRNKRYGQNSGKPQQDTSAAFLSQTQLSGEDKKTAHSFADNIMGESRYQTLSLDENVVEHESATRYEDLRATTQARRSVAMLPINRAVNRRSGDEGKPSEQDILHEEVKRTWGSSQWRKELNEKAAPTPVLKEIANMASVSNKILLTQLERLEESNLLLGTLVLESLESPDRKKAMAEAYKAAYNPHAKRDKT